MTYLKDMNDLSGTSMVSDVFITVISNNRVSPEINSTSILRAFCLTVTTHALCIASLPGSSMGTTNCVIGAMTLNT